MRACKVLACLFLLLGLAGCYTTDPPLVFGKIDKIGISASASAPEQGADLTLGYRSTKLAVVPVTVRDDYGNVVVMKVSRQGNNEGAFSTFSHFAVAADATKATACLGDTFATGLAAQAIADKLPDVCN